MSVAVAVTAAPPAVIDAASIARELLQPPALAPKAIPGIQSRRHLRQSSRCAARARDPALLLDPGTGLAHRALHDSELRDGVASVPAQGARRLDPGARPVEQRRFEKHTDVSAFMTTPWLWEQLVPARHVLLFQLDSIICANAPVALDDFLRYDLVGAPIPDRSGWGLGFNGGLSLRNLDKTLQIVRASDWAAEVKDSKEKGLDGVPILPTGTSDINDVFPGHANSPRIQYEDQWFFKKFMELPGAVLPPLNVSKTFSVESVPYDTPFGYHKPSYATPEEKKHLDEYCPEYSLATSQSIIDA
ncbi:hypothetical protein PVAG01_03108 [Phlyctema vagabunda]|uniref:DUF5672 domain-containing protein n=1 Tax=Phlyctema vagabunda TaxID=108571 RepID=A0ABR4PSL5_9HELO